MKKIFSLMAVPILLLWGFDSFSFASWLIYHKPEFHGKIIDADTKEPIEGAVVAAVYYTYPIISGPGGGSAKIINIKEALTNEEGVFKIDSYTTFIQPLSMESTVNFIIYKPGYESYPNFDVYPTRYSSLNSLFTNAIGTEKKVRINMKQVTILNGIVELKKLKTLDERRKARDFIISYLPARRWPILHKMIQDELKWIKNNKGWNLR